MKSFIVALLLFLLMVGLVILNSFYVNQTLEKISELSDEISNSEQCHSALNELIEYWFDSRALLGFSIKETKLERMTELIESLKSACQAKDTGEIKRICALIRELCKETRDYEKISIQSIF